MIGPLAGLPGNGVHVELTVLHLIIQVLACMHAARPRAHGDYLLSKLYPLASTTVSMAWAESPGYAGVHRSN
jgi:hypothetical protein